MLSWLIRRKIDAFEREYEYDMDYARDLVGTSLEAMMLFHKATQLGNFRRGLPKDAWYAARLIAIRLEDCGPCTQLMVRMAERDQQSPEVIRAVLGGRLDEVSDDVQLSVEFTKATLARDPRLDDLRRQVVERWGRAGLVSLAFAMLSSRLYPTLKYALGYGHTCSVVHINGEPLSTPREAL